MEHSKPTSTLALSGVGVVLALIAVPFWRAARSELEGVATRDVVLADRAPYQVLLALAGLYLTLLVAHLATPGGLPVSKRPPRPAQIVIVAGMLLTVLMAFTLDAAALRIAMSTQGRSRCEALDELRRGNVKRNDRTVHAYVDLRTASPATIARCVGSTP